MPALLEHQCAHRRAAAGDLAPLVLAAGSQELYVEVRQVTRLGYRHPVVAPKVADFALDPPFFVGFLGRAELALEAPMRAEGDEARSLLAAMTAQDLLYCASQVIVT